MALVLCVLGADAPPVRTVDCFRATGAIVVDGRGDEAAWTAIEPLTDFRLWHTFGKPTESTAEARPGAVGQEQLEQLLYALLRLGDDTR